MPSTSSGPFGRRDLPGRHKAASPEIGANAHRNLEGQSHTVKEEQYVEDKMFRFVGFLVVTSFALYGAVNFVARHVVTKKQAGTAAG